MKTEKRRTDRRGRVQRTAEERRALIEDYRGSGLGKAEFCRQRGVNLATFCHWFDPEKKRRRKRRPKAIASAPKFAEVAVHEQPGVQAAIEVLLPNGSRIGIHHQGQRDELVALVRGGAGC